MFRRGRRLFSSASIGLVLVAIAHTLGSFAPRDEKRRAFERTATDLTQRIRVWLSLPAVSSRTGLARAGHLI